MGLLSAAELAEIRDAVKSVTDTFMITPIEYYKHVSMTDPNMEDNIEEAFKKYQFNAMAEYPAGIEANEMQKYNEGNFDFGDIMLTMNIEDMQTVGLIDNDLMPSNSTEMDYFKCQGKLYKVLDTALDGPLETKQVLVLMSGELYTKDKSFTNLVP